jgi:hypothetical protein
LWYLAAFKNVLKKRLPERYIEYFSEVLFIKIS